ncbi:hypothetical protein EDC02_3106 [Micromonospora sp. Llam0]|nr:hypothetical protein EDC02_3106 [Micromonospora sp. Llam0]
MIAGADPPDGYVSPTVANAVGAICCNRLCTVQVIVNRESTKAPEASRHRTRAIPPARYESTLHFTAADV